MPTPPDFTNGTALDASSLNAVGLWRVTNCTASSVGGTAATASNGVVTVGTGNTSVTVSAAFSSTYDNYRVIYTGGTMSTATSLTLKLGSATAGVFGALIYANYATAGLAASADNNTASFQHFGGGDTTGCGGIMDLMMPNAAYRTRVIAGPMNYGNFFGTYTGIIQDSTQYTAFTIAPAAGTMTGGQIRVYGYRN